MPVASPFDVMAQDYDRAFTHSPIGRYMRAATWRRIDAAFCPGDRVLELNCGTGEDAVHLSRRGVRVLATDASPQMVAATKAKLATADMVGDVQTEVLRIEDLSSLRSTLPFDGVLSNFGGLNCVSDFAAVGRDLAMLLRSGGRALLCLMGPAVPWEWAWFLARGEPRRAARRLDPAGAAWHGLRIRYPSIRRLRRDFEPWFRCTRVSAIGALVPPSFADEWARKHPRLLRTLDRCERRFEAVPPLPQLADHYLIELERNDAPVER